MILFQENCCSDLQSGWIDSNLGSAGHYWSLAQFFFFSSGVELSYSSHEEHGGDYGNDDDGDYFDTEECKRVNLPSNLRATCTISEHCSKLTCTSPEGVPKQDLTFKINRCQNPLTATILMCSQGQEWSHTFKSGEETKLPTPPPGYPSQPGEPQMTIYLRLVLEKLGDRVKFRVSCIGIDFGSKRDLQVHVCIARQKWLEVEDWLLKWYV